MPSQLLTTAHALNLAAWACVAFTLLTVTSLGKPAFLGLCLSLPLFGLSLKGYNAVTRQQRDGQLVG